MKNKFLDAAISFFAVLLFTGVINFFGQYFAQPNGTIRIGQFRNPDSTQTVIVDIENNSDDQVNELLLLVPIYTKFEDIATSTPIVIEEPKNQVSNATKILSISNIPARATTTIAIRPILIGDNKLIAIANAAETKFTHSSPVTENKATKAMKSILLPSIVYALLSALLAWYVAVKHNEPNSQHQNNSKRLEQINTEREKDIGQLRQEMKSIEEHAKNELIKIRTIHLRANSIIRKRLSEQQQELDFWRYTIRSILSSTKKSKAFVKELLMNISKSLGNYSASKSSFDILEIESLAELIAKEHHEIGVENILTDAQTELNS